MISSEPQAQPICWKTRRTGLDLTRQAIVMGILNVTPDSFSDGGQFSTLELACHHAHAMIAEGAAIIDVGGESTRPGATPVAAIDEIKRVIPVIERLRTESDVLISIDTSKAAVARAALEAGADIVNDVTALTGDADMAGVVAASRAGLVLMHMQGSPQTMQKTPRYSDVVTEVGKFLRHRMEAALRLGIDPMCIALDPGIGFGKSHDHNRALLREAGSFAVDGRPVMLGVSRKSFLAWAADAPEVGDRLWPSVAISALTRELGVRIFRVHDVRPHVEAVRMTEAIMEGVSPT